MLRWRLSTVRVAGGRASHTPFLRTPSSRAHSSRKLGRQLEDCANSSDASVHSRVTLATDPSYFDNNSHVELGNPGRSQSDDRQHNGRPIVFCPTCAVPLDLAGVPVLDEGAISPAGHVLAQHHDAAKCFGGVSVPAEALGHRNPTAPGVENESSLNDIVGNPSSVNTKAADYSALKLRDILSPPNFTPVPPKGLWKIRRLYLSAKTRGQLYLLTSANFSSLISLFGSLSLSTPQNPYSSVHAHAWTPHLLGSGSRQHWLFVRQLADSKQAAGKTLSHSDRYWVMRFHLAQLTFLDGENTTSSWPPAVGHSLRSAGHFYRKIYRFQAHFDVHVPYLRALMSFPTAERIHEVVSYLCDLLGWHNQVHPRIFALIWQVVLQPDVALPSAMKERLLVALWQRVGREACKDHDESQDSPDVPHMTSSGQSDDITVHDLVVSLNDTVFALSKASASLDPTRRQVSSWAFSVARAVLSPDEDGNDLDARWSYVFLLAFASSAHGSPRGRKAASSAGISQKIAVADWQVVCALESLERLFRTVERSASPSFQPAVVEGLSRILEALWRDWSAIGSSGSRPPVVARAICASFLRLVGRLKTRALRTLCQEYCVASGLWRVEHSGSTSLCGIRALARELMLCTLACSARIDFVLGYIIDCVDNPELVSDIVSACVSRYSETDVELAQELRTMAQHAGIDITTDCLSVLAVNMVKQGLGGLALEVLADHRLSPQQQLRILRPMLSVLIRHRFGSLPRQFTSGVGDAMSTLFAHTAPPRRLRWHLENVLIMLLDGGHLSQALATIEGLARSDPSFFRVSFLSTFLRTLLDRRQFRVAERIFYLSITLHPDNRLKWLRLLLVRYAQGGANVLASRMAKLYAAEGVKPSLAVSLARTVGFYKIPPSQMSTLKISSLLARGNRRKSPAARYAVHLLALVGRLRAAKQVYGELQDHQPPHALTMMGNTIVHASMMHRTRRNMRRMRKVLDTVAELTEKFKFVPDRVTVNVLLKALMRWRTEVTSEKLRALFDRLVLSGYPSGGGASASKVLPFGTDAGSASQGFDLPKLTTPISFVRHVRPLYKMFIKTFYLKGDVAAARTVVGILKAIQTEALMTKDKRQTAMMTGRPTARLGAMRRRSDGEVGKHA